MEQSYPLMLSPLRDKREHGFKGATEFGKWLPLPGTLGELGQALDIDLSKPVDVVRSTPDPWAQARAFADALRRPERSPATIAQWRGLLAVLALAAYYENDYALVFQPVDLAKSKTRFATVMQRLVPEAALPIEQGKISHGWERPVLVRLKAAGTAGDGVAIGMLNPGSLIAGGRDLDKLPLAAVPWWRSRGGLQDPTTLTGEDALPPAALFTLRTFLEALRSSLVTLAAADPDHSLLGQLLKELDHYARACVPGIGGHREDLTPSGPPDATLPALYALLQGTQKVAEPAPGRSDCLVKLRSDLGGDLPVKGVVLFDETLPASLGRPANAIVLWGRRTLADAINNPATLEELGKRIAEAGYLLVRPAQLFTQVLVKLDERDQPALIAAHPDSLDDCLLPLSPLALLIYRPVDLPNAVALNRNGQVTLTVPLETGRHSIVRTYSDQPDTGEGQLLDEIDWGYGEVAIWPNFTNPRWSRYCARLDYATNAVGRLRGRFALSGELLVQLLREGPGNGGQPADWFSAAPLSESGRPALDPVRPFADRSYVGKTLTRFRASNSGNRAAEVQVASTPFEAVFFTVLTATDQPPVPAGLALLKIPGVDEQAGDPSGTVAIDFGTTNTVACLDSEQPVVLHPRIVHPLEPARGNAGMRTAESVKRFRDFLPVDERKLPTPTVTIRRDMDAEGRQELEQNTELQGKLLLYHLMYFQPDYADDGTIAAVPLNEWSSLLNRIQYNLKWSDDPVIKDAAQRYLRQLMMMIAAEWASTGRDPAKLVWYFSRPDDNDLASFTGLLQTALRDIVPAAPDNAIRRITMEADAAADFILKERSSASGTRGQLNIILDIGGGTTDIAIRDIEGKPLGSLSLRVAGGDFFTDHIMANPDILSDFGLKSWAGVVQRMGGESDAAVKANIRYVGELLFSGRTLDEAIDRSWHRVSGTAPVRALKETALLFLGGVAWYVGRAIGELIRVGKVDRSALREISVALCGRGAGLFKRLHGLDPLAETEVSNILLLIAVAAGDDEPYPIQVQVSRYPKIEVAAGMIIRAATDTGDEVRPAAERPRKRFGGAADAGDTVAAPAAQAAGATPAFTLRVPAIGMEQLDPFLAAFDVASGIAVALTDHQRAKLTNGIKEIDREDVRAKREEQSEFAAMLKVLIGLIRTPAGSAIRPTTQWR